MNRAQRRHHRNRLKKNRRIHWDQDLIDDPKLLSKAVDTPCACSCPLCGNPRRHFAEKTMQEKKADLLERETS